LSAVWGAPTVADGAGSLPSLSTLTGAFTSVGPAWAAPVEPVIV
jgi:hypothetical protein